MGTIKFKKEQRIFKCISTDFHKGKYFTLGKYYSLRIDQGDGIISLADDNGDANVVTKQHFEELNKQEYLEFRKVELREELRKVEEEIEKENNFEAGDIVVTENKRYLFNNKPVQVEKVENGLIYLTSGGFWHKEDTRKATREEIEEFNRPKFEVGDIVAIESNENGGNFPIGTVGKIKSRGNNPEFRVESYGDCWYYDSSELRKATPEEAETHNNALFEVGDVVVVLGKGINYTEHSKYKKRVDKGDLIKIAEFGVCVHYEYPVKGKRVAIGEKGEVVYIEQYSSQFRKATPEEIKKYYKTKLPEIHGFSPTETTNYIQYGCTTLKKSDVLKIWDLGIRELTIRRDGDDYSISEDQLEQIVEVIKN